MRKQVVHEWIPSLWWLEWFSTGSAPVRLWWYGNGFFHHLLHRHCHYQEWQMCDPSDLLNYSSKLPRGRSESPMVHAPQLHFAALWFLQIYATKPEKRMAIFSYINHSLFLLTHLSVNYTGTRFWEASWANTISSVELLARWKWYGDGQDSWRKMMGWAALKRNSATKHIVIETESFIFL